MTSTTETVQRVIATVLGLGPESAATLTDTHHLFDDLEADSLDAVSIVVELEEALGIDIADDDLVRYRTVGDLIEIVNAAQRRTAA